MSYQALSLISNYSWLYDKLIQSRKVDQNKEFFEVWGTLWKLKSKPIGFDTYKIHKTFCIFKDPKITKFCANLWVNPILKGRKVDQDVTKLKLYQNNFDNICFVFIVHKLVFIWCWFCSSLVSPRSCSHFMFVQRKYI